MLKSPNDSLWRSFFIILLPNQSAPPFFCAARRRTERTNPVRRISGCLVVTVTEACPVGHTRAGLKGTKLDHGDTQREHYSQYKWLSAGLIDKLPLHFISQTDRA